MADKITGISTNDFQLSIVGYGKIASDADDIIQSIFIILFTRPGDDPMRPLFGCDYIDFIDQPVTVAVPNMVNSIYSAIKLNEPRVSIQSVKSVAIGSRIFFDLSLTRLSTGETIAFRFPNIALPDIIGPVALCEGRTYTFTDPMPGGVWSIVNGSGTASIINTISGLYMQALTAGTITIVYTLGAQSVSLSPGISVVPIFGPITGPDTVAPGSTITLIAAVGGGIWTSDNTDIATIDATTGVVTGVSIGDATIIYTVTNAGGCSFSQGWGVSVADPYYIAFWPKYTAQATAASASLLPDTLGYWAFELVDGGFIVAGTLTASFAASPNLEIMQTNRIWSGASTMLLCTPIGLGAPADYLIKYQAQKHDIGIGQSNDGIFRRGTLGTEIFILLADTGIYGAGGGTQISNCYVQPFVVLDPLSQTPKATLMADMDLQPVGGAATGYQRIRVIRSHTAIDTGILRDPCTTTFGWSGVLSGGFPDPDDPTNPDKICFDVQLGGYLYRIGVSTIYTDVASGKVYGKSDFLMSIMTN